jgi:cytoskeletal protein CcmA (bactofilin family)
MGTYVNNLRLLEIATGGEDGTWGTKTNTNLELIADAFGSGTEAITTNADTHTTTIADGAADEGRALFLKYTGTLDSACTITIAPNTVNKLWFIENATSGSQNIIISQGSGANITIGNGKVAAVYTDGAGSGAAVLDVFADLEISSTLTVAGNVTMSADATVGDDLTLLSDAAVLGFGADTDVTLTHVADTGLLLNSTMAIQFNDASQYINAPSNAILDINATDEIELNATLADVNANLDVSGTLTAAGNADLNGDLDVDGTTNLDAVDIDGAVQIDSTVTVGVDDTGYDVKFFGDTASAYMLWDTSTDDLVLAGAAGIDLAGDLDVDGTTNLDVVDIDGAVDMASTLVVNDKLTVNKGSNSSVIELGGSPGANWEGDILFNTSNSATNWRIASNRVTAGAFTITPSTSGGGSTYTTPRVTVTDGAMKLAGSDTMKLEFLNAAGTLRSFLTLNSTSLEIDTDSALIFSPNNSERARIDDSGRLGLGTASPHSYYSVSNKFVIANTGGSTGMTFATSNTGQARIDFAEGTSGAEQYRGTISYNHAATESEGYLRFVAGGAEALRLGSDYVLMGNLPTSDPGVATALYNDSGTLKISAG